MRNRTEIFIKLFFTTIFSYNFFCSNNILDEHSAGNLETCVEQVTDKLSTNDLEECIERINKIADSKTLLVLDCDEVLISYERFFYYKYYTLNDAGFFGQFKQADLNPKSLTDILGINPGWNTILENLSRKGTKTVVLTATNYVDHMFIDYKLSILRECIGFNFDALIPNAHSPSEVVFRDGVIFACKQQKGNVLVNFMKAYYKNDDHIKFDKIIFVDDRSFNITSVRKSETKFAAFNVKLYTIELLAARNHFERKLKDVFHDDKEKFKRYEEFVIKYPSCSDNNFFILDDAIFKYNQHRHLPTIREEDEDEKDDSNETSDSSSSEYVIM